jgi:hypothetical protein
MLCLAVLWGTVPLPFSKTYPCMPKHLRRLVPASFGFPACKDSFTCFSRSTPALSSPQAFWVSEELAATPAQGRQCVVLERN